MCVCVCVCGVYMGVVRCVAEVDERKHKKSGRAADHPPIFFVMMMCVSVLCWLLRNIRAQVDVAATLTDGGGATTITLDVVDGGTSYITQADFESTVNEAWLIIMATFVFRTFSRLSLPLLLLSCFSILLPGSLRNT